MYTVTPDNYFDVARALHWYCVKNHGGMYSDEYKVRCELGYVPGPLESGVQLGAEAGLFYDALSGKELQPKALLWDIQAIQLQDEG